MTRFAFGAKCGIRGERLAAKTLSLSNEDNAIAPMPKPVCLKKWRRVMSRSCSDCLFISEPRLFAVIDFPKAHSNVQLAFARVARMARNPPVIGALPGKSAAERGYDRVNRVAPAVSHHRAAMRVADLNVSRQPFYQP